MMDSEASTPAKAESEDLMIAGWTFHASAHQLERDGETIRLEPKATLVLAYLAQRAHQPVGREELLEPCGLE